MYILAPFLSAIWFSKNLPNHLPSWLLLDIIYGYLLHLPLTNWVVKIGGQPSSNNRNSAKHGPKWPTRGGHGLLPGTNPFISMGLVGFQQIQRIQQSFNFTNHQILSLYSSSHHGSVENGAKQIKKMSLVPFSHFDDVFWKRASCRMIAASSYILPLSNPEYLHIFSDVVKDFTNIINNVISFWEG